MPHPLYLVLWLWSVLEIAALHLAELGFREVAVCEWPLGWTMRAMPGVQLQQTRDQG